MRKLYRLIKPFKRESLRVSNIHRLYVEQSGNPRGESVVVLHGGPGSPSKPRHRRYYDPDKYRIIIFDQRGCGKSKPLGELRENTTQDLVEDIEKIRKHLGIDKWYVSGGSWGSTLALAYAEAHPEKVKALFLRGIYTGRKFESEWVTKMGANIFFPENWEKYSSYIPEKGRKNLTKAYAKIILKGKKKEAKEAARIASNWEGSLLRLVKKEEKVKKFTEKDFVSARIFAHYEIHKSFLKEGQLLREADKIKNVPGFIVQGRYDMICPPITAWELHKAWPKSKMEFVTPAGHYGTEKGIIEKFLEYTDRFADLYK